MANQAGRKEQGQAGRNGRVVRAASDSFKELEKVAQQVQTKGCFINRGGAHRHEKKIVRFLNVLEEDELPFGQFSAEQLQIAPLRDSDCRDGSACEDPSCKFDANESVLAGPEEIRQACAQLVADLPSSFREDIRIDAEAIADMCVRLCPEVPWLTLRLEVTQYDACWRWHQDAYVSRTLITYVGPGTWAADDASVRWDEFAKALEEKTNDKCVPQESIKCMETNAVLLMKGNAWPGISGEGLTHKSPEPQKADQPAEPPKRLLLKVDLHEIRPPLADEDFDSDVEYDDDEEDEEDGGEEEDEEDEKDEKGGRLGGKRGRSATKQHAPSPKAKSSKATKRSR